MPAWSIAVLIIVVVVILYFVILWSIRAHQRKIAAGREELVGRTAVVEVALEPKGVVLVEGERWTAIAEERTIEPEEEVIITKVDGLKLMVTRKTSKQ
ncbi:MAG: serine protease [Dehalococcoidales bacterium]|nr:serine protease [Dehalococcoidales bacterium]